MKTASLPSGAHTSAPVLEPLAAVGRRHRLPALGERLAELQRWLGDDLRALTGAVAAVAAASQGLPGARVAGAAGHLLDSHGKFLRPVCLLLGARMGEGEVDPAAGELALACELVHAATLLHDDVIDDSPERRGAAASRVLFGNSASILAGDHLLTAALRRVLATGHTDLLASLLEVIAAMVAAEARQLERRGRLDLDRAAYMMVIRGKTAGLFAWALAAGGALAGQSPGLRQQLHTIGSRLGIAFQLVDDILDLEGDPVATGKSGLADLRQGKLTWPVILACENDPVLRDQLAVLIAADPTAEPDGPAMAAWVKRLLATDAVAQTRALARQEADAACAAIASLPPGPAARALAAVVDAAVDRLS